MDYQFVLMSRPIEQVYGKIIKQIPQDQVDLRVELEKFIEGIWNKAPEVRRGPELYLSFAHILAQHIDPHESHLSGWKKQVVDIFNGNPNENSEFVEDMDDFDYLHHTMAHY